jgi:hypothetical protein
MESDLNKLITSLCNSSQTYAKKYFRPVDNVVRKYLKSDIIHINKEDSSEVKIFT